MHPNPLFRSEDTAALGKLVDEIGFVSVFLTTPDGPRVAHAPVVGDGAGSFLFHLARSNALTPHLDGATALMVANGPDGYVSPRWYEDRATVPTWDYVAIELEGTVSQLDDAALENLLHRLTERSEERLPAPPWQASEAPAALWDKLFAGIVGFRLDVAEWRPTLKLSQKRSVTERNTIALAQEILGKADLAAMMKGTT